jgi:hypothetical protein
MKTLETGISTQIINSRVEVYTPAEAIKLEHSKWWNITLKKNTLNPNYNMLGFLNWYSKTKNIHVISNDEFLRINEKLS